AQTADTYYNGVLLNSSVWDGIQEVAGIDLWSPNAAASVYFDDLQFAPVMTVDHTLSWDGDVGTWSELGHAPDSHWIESGAATVTPEIPTLGAIGTSGDAASVASGALTVTSDQGAYSLDITGGTVTIDPGATLEIYDATTVASPGVLAVNGTLDTYSLTNDGPMTLGVDAVLKTDSGTLQDINTVGDATFQGGATATVLKLASGSTFTKAYGGILDVSAAGVIDGSNTIEVDGGELRLQAAIPLNGAAVVLNGGKLTTTQAIDISSSTISVTADSAVNAAVINLTANYGAVTFDGDGALAIEGQVNDVGLASTTVQAGVVAELVADIGPNVLTGPVTLGVGAQLTTSGANTVTLGQVTLTGSSGGIGRSGAGDQIFDNYAGGAGKTLSIIGGGRTVLSLGATDAVGTKFSIVDDSTLSGSGLTPLAGAAEVELGGGTLELELTGTDMTAVTITVIALPAIPANPPDPAVPSMPSSSILNTDSDPNFGVLSIAGDGVVTTAGTSTQISFSSATVGAGATGGIVADAQIVDVGAITVADGGVFVGSAVNSGVLNYTSLTLTGASGGIGGTAGQTMTLHDYSGGVSPKTLLIGGAGRTLLDYGGTLELMSNTTIKVTGGGTLEVSTADPLAGAQGVILSDGALDIHVSAGGPTSALAYYSFENVVGTTVSNDTPGSTLYDGTLSSKSGAVAGITTGSGGKIGEAMTIGAGTSQFLDVADGGVPLGSDWTISTWLYNLHADTGPRALAKTAAADFLALMLKDSNAVGMRLGSSMSFSTAELAPSDGWRHLTMVGSSDETKFYIDGVLSGTLTGQAASPVASFGSYAGSYPFAEKLDEFLVYDSALNQGQIDALYTAGVLGDYPIDLSGLSIDVEAAGQLNLTGGYADLGSLNFTASGAELTVGSATGFSGVTIGPGVSTAGLNIQAPVTVGPVDAGGQTVEIIKSGEETLTLTGDGVGLDNTTFTVVEGRLIGVKASNPVGGATLHPAGGEIVIGSAVASDTLSYTNTIVSDGGTITAGAPGAENVTVNIPNGMTLNSGDLKLRTNNGNSLNVTGLVTGPGYVDIGVGASVELAGGGPYVFGGATVSGGTLTTDDALVFDRLDILSGTFTQTGAAGSGERDLTIASSLTVGVPLDMTGENLDVATATVKVDSALLTVDAPLVTTTMDLSVNGSLALGGNNLVVSDTLMVRKGQFVMSNGAPALVSHGNITPTVDPTQLDVSGGTMLITGLGVSFPNQLNYAFYDDVANDSTKPELSAIDDGVANGLNGGLFVLTPSPEIDRPAQVQGKSTWTGPVSTTGMSDYYSQMWWGTFNAPESGVYTFYVHGDDFEILWMDLNHNGDYEAATEQITSNPPDGSGGGWNTPKTETVTLNAGESYDFALAHNEGGGGDWLNVTIQLPTAPAGIPINPSDPAQFDWWSVGDINSSGTIMPNTDLLVTADSTVESRFSAELGVLKVDGVDTLTFDVGAVRKLTFQSTEITGAAGGAVTFDIDG
ncbi:MAG: PA14 domain-containing protein, partial [Phycisphaerae bacterium]|nr:PA14 domain-containing protein [Phycisphaerae bacterium]